MTMWLGLAPKLINLFWNCYKIRYNHVFWVNIYVLYVQETIVICLKDNLYRDSTPKKKKYKAYG